MRKPKYQTVNAVWPDEIPALTGSEAITAAKRLWRITMGKPCPYRVVLSTGHRAGRFPTSIYGTRLLRDDHNKKWPKVVLVVSPMAGWHELVHSLSHKVHRKLHPGKSDHDDLGRHAFIEKTMIAHVIKSGWLDGKLKRPEKPKAPVDKIAQRHARVLAGIERWDAKIRRARNALKKLHRQRAYYERKLAA